jgi:hypothetical protein
MRYDFLVDTYETERLKVLIDPGTSDPAVKARPERVWTG